jgi:hypothetical protein
MGLYLPLQGRDLDFDRHVTAPSRMECPGDPVAPGPRRRDRGRAPA